MLADVFYLCYVSYQAQAFPKVAAELGLAKNGHGAGEVSVALAVEHFEAAVSAGFVSSQTGERERGHAHVQQA